MRRKDLNSYAGEALNIPPILKVLHWLHNYILPTLAFLNNPGEEQDRGICIARG